MMKSKNYVAVKSNLKNITTSFFFLWYSVLLVSCSVPVTCEFFNNSAMEVKISKIVDDNQIKEVVIESGKVATIKEWEFGLYKIQIDDEIYTFRPSTFEVNEEKFVSYRGALFWGKRLLKVQLEPNRKIYLLHKDETFPLHDFSSQPNGFPINLKTTRE